MIEVGGVYVKLAGRESGLKVVIVDKIDKNFVLVDGEVKRRRCNVNHLKPLNFKVDIKPKASTAVVRTALEKLGLITAKLKVNAKPKVKKTKAPRPKKQKLVKKPLKVQKPEAKAKKTKPKKQKTKKAAPKPAKKTVKKAKPKKKSKTAKKK